LSPGFFIFVLDAPYKFTPLVKFALFHFLFKARWLAAIHYAKSLFIMTISYLICSPYLRSLFQEHNYVLKQGLRLIRRG